MFTRTKNRKAISTVIVTLIILVASVVLGTGVVLYGTSLFQTGAQSQSISTQGVQVWVNTTTTTGWTWGAAAIRNDGDKILSVDTISVRGTQVPFSSWYFDSNAVRVTSTNFQSQLNYTGTTAVGIMKNSNSTVLAASSPAGCSGTGATFAINEFGSKSSNPTMCFAQASGPVSLKPGDKAIIYFQIPTGILSSVDAGSSSSVALYAGKVGAPVTVTVQSKS
jgi:hypothetical protein